jgi:20S proteasome alpha/beta subunit
MTIAAGFQCQGGLLICADTLVSGGDVNIAEKKIYAFNIPNMNANAVFSFAGTVPHCRSAINKIYHALNALPQSESPLTDLMVNGIIEDVITQYYQQHLFKHPRFGYADGPSIYLLAAIQYRDTKSTSLFTTVEDAVTQEGSFAFVGVGEPIARYIIEPLVYPAMRMQPKHALLLADHVLHQVKRFVPDCGGASLFFWLGHDGSFHHASPQIMLPELYSDTWRRITADLFYAAADVDLDDHVVGIGLMMAEKRIKEIRKEQRVEKKRRDSLRRWLIPAPLIGDPGTPPKIPRPKKRSRKS